MRGWRKRSNGELHTVLQSLVDVLRVIYTTAMNIRMRGMTMGDAGSSTQAHLWTQRVPALVPKRFR